MKYLKFFFIVIFSVVCIKSYSQVSEEQVVDESDWSYGVNAGFSNKYLWRGMVFNNGLVFQPEAFIGWRDFSVNLWSNTTLYDKDGINAHEVDITLDYYHSFSNFDFESFFSYYAYIDQEDVPNTVEWNTSAFYHLGDFTLSAGLNVDVLENAGASYLEIALDYEKALSDKFTFSGKVMTGIGSKKFNGYNLDVAKTTMNLVGGNVGLSYCLIENLFIDANFYQNFFIDKDLRNSEIMNGVNSNAFELVLRKEF